MATSPSAFISYRRSDSSQAIQGLFTQLRTRFGSGKVFMDVGSVGPGDPWPERIRRALDRATLVLVGIGPLWLTSADLYGRRRLDQQDDWVRRELEHAFDFAKHVVPVLIGSRVELPPVEALPESLQRLTGHQAIRLREDSWESDVDRLVATMVKTYGFVATQKRVILPQPQVKVEPISESDLEDELSKRQHWEPVESEIPGDYPNVRLELRRTYSFRSFKKAIEFMSLASASIHKLQHHPRWENQWRTLTVHLTTWDIGNRITHLDLELADTLDQLYARFR